MQYSSKLLQKLALFILGTVNCGYDIRCKQWDIYRVDLYLLVLQYKNYYDFVHITHFHPFMKNNLKSAGHHTITF